MQLHRDDFEIIKVIGRGAFGEVRDFTRSNVTFIACASDFLLQLTCTSPKEKRFAQMY